MSLDLKLLYSDFNFTVDKSSFHKIYEFEDFRLDTAHLMLYRGAEEIPLAPKAVETLIALIERRGEIVHKDDLMESIWTDSIVEESNLSKYLHVLRKTLGKQQNGNPFIETLRRRGYRFSGEVSVGDYLPEAKPETSNQKFTPLFAPLNIEADGEAATGKIIAPADWQDEPEADEKPSEAVAIASQTTEFPAVKRKSFLRAAAAGLIVLGLAVFVFLKFRSETPPAKNAHLKTLAVLPFVNASQDPNTEYLSDGVTENIINNLAQLSGLKVISKNSSFRFKDDQTDIKTIASQLGVENLITGNIRQINDRFIINVRLIDAADDSQIWGTQYVKTTDNIFAVQNEIAQAVAGNLRVILTDAERRLLNKKPTENFEAYQLYLRGRANMISPNTSKAINYFEQAIDIDPNYAPAYVGLASAYRILVLADDAPPGEMMPKAKAAAMRALELDNGSAEAHAVLGTGAFFYEWNWDEAEKYFQRALQLDPNSSDAHFYYAHLLSNLGRHEEALAELKHAIELDPLYLGFSTLEGQFLFYAGKYDEAVDQLKKTSNLEPNFWLPHLFISRVYIEKGMFREAVEEATKAREMSGGNTEAISFIGYALAKSGEKEKALEMLEELKKLSAEKYVPPFNIALVYNALGETDEVFKSLEKGFQVKDVRMTFLKVDPKWNNLRNDPRFIDLMRRMNFE